jgi:hypothetical protein
MHAVTIGTADGDRVTISVLGRMHGDATDFWDGNWLISPIEVHVGSFAGRISAGLRSDEIQGFREDLERVYRDLHGTARLTSMEEWLDLTMTITATGQFEVAGRMIDNPGSGNELRFEIDGLDQSHAPELIDGLLTLQRAYPVVGLP